MGLTTKEIILMSSSGLMFLLDHTLFEALLFCVSLIHMGLIAVNSCHENGLYEASPFCGKVWDQCMIANNITNSMTSDTNCTLRLCFDVGCKTKSMAWQERPLFSILLYLANFWMRWVYTGLCCLRLIGRGVVLSENAFFRNPWCLLDFLVVALAWLNTPYNFGNVMFWMVLRGAKIIFYSTGALLETPRIQFKALGLGIFKVFVVFVFINFILAFVSLLGMSLIGSKGDFHMRCAVPVWHNDGGNVSFVYEPLVPERPCRPDSNFKADVIRCYGDVWSTTKTNFTPSSQTSNGLSQPGCHGTCSTVAAYSPEILGKELNMKVQGVDNYNNPISADGVYCIGPDMAELDAQQFPPSPAGVKGGNMMDYVPANLSKWPSYGANDPRNFDDMGHSAIVLYTIFYRQDWSDVLFPVIAIGGFPVVIAWMIVMVFVSYYLLNITVSITCSHYSEATVQEAAEDAARKKAAAEPKDEDEEEEGDDDEDEGDQAVEEPKSVRQKQLDSLEKAGVCGNGCDCFVLLGSVIVKGLTIIGTLIASKLPPFIGKLLTNVCNNVQTNCMTCCKACCHACITLSIRLVFPPDQKKNDTSTEEDGDTEDKAQPGKPNSILSSVSVVCMLGCMLSQGLQTANISMYKCACSDGDVNQLDNNWDGLPNCDPVGCLNLLGKISSNTTCIHGKCVAKSFQGYACYNPQKNYLIQRGNLTGGLKQPPAELWMDLRANWCNYGMLLHYVLYIWAVIFFLELCARYLAHQGLRNFFTTTLDPEIDDKGKPLVKPNWRNIVDSVCILSTVAGIVLTEFSIPSEFTTDNILKSQILLAGVSFNNPQGDGTGVPWVMKLLRLATIIRIGARIQRLARIPMVSMILRGFRGPEKVTLGLLVLTFVVVFSAITAKELLDYGYSSLREKFVGRIRFEDLSSSIIPMMQIMCGSGWYDYAEAATNALGVHGFVFFCVYYFVVFFQFQRIFIAIIVQNFELTEDEKLMAQKLILNMKFEKVSYDKSNVELNEFFSGDAQEPPAGKEYDGFSFTSHYQKLLRGSKLSLRALISYSEHLASGGRGFSTEMENSLIDDDIKYADEELEAGEEPDEMDVLRKQMNKIREQLTINPQKLKKNEAPRDPDYKEPFATQISKLCRKLVDENQYWLALVILVILFSVALAVYTDIDKDTGVKGLGDLLSVGFLAFFLAEMTLKMIAYGVYSSGGAICAGYFNRAWCTVDFLLVCAQAFDVVCSLFPDVISMGEQGGILRGFRAVRALRFLVAVKKVNKDSNPLQMIMAALGASIPAIFTLLVAVIFVMFIYALVGMDQYAGLLSRCTSEDELDNTGTKCRMDSHCSPGYAGQCPFVGIGTYRYCRMDKIHCVENRERTPSAYSLTNFRSMASDHFKFLAPRQWTPPPLNFDNLYSSLFTVFSLINKSNLEPMLTQLLCTTERDKAPVANNSPLNAIFLFSVFLFVGIFVSQIVIGLIMTNLRLKSGLAFHTKEQLVWPATQDAISSIYSRYSPFLAKGAAGDDELEDLHPLLKIAAKIRNKFRGIRDSWKFDLLMSVTVAFNCTLLATYYYDMDGMRQTVYFWGGFACFVLYCLEFFVNALADLVPYISVGRNQFDIFLTVLTALELWVFPQLGFKVGLASLRMFRLLKLLYKSSTFSALMDVISSSFPEAAATVLINVVVIFVFAALAANMFNDLKEGVVLNDPWHFHNFANAMLTVFRLSSGEDWGTVITDAAIVKPLCTPALWLPVDGNATAGGKTALVKERTQNFMGIGEWRQWDINGHIQIKSDCGSEFTAYPLFLLFIFINNYMLLPTFIASIIASYFKANLFMFSLIREGDLQKYQMAWIDADPDRKMSGSYLTIKRSNKITEGKLHGNEKIENPWDFTKFHLLLSLLDQTGCVLGFDKTARPDKYKMAVLRMKLQASKGGGDKLQIDYKTMCVILLSISEKARPVTIVDILRREAAQKVLKVAATQKPPKKAKPKGAKSHAAFNLPPEHLKNKKLTSLTEQDITYSYNLYVVLDQLARINQEAKGPSNDPVRLTPKELKDVKSLVDANDEDLLIFFEEYIEKSGPEYVVTGGAWKAFLRFGMHVKDVHARSFGKKAGTQGEIDAEVDGDKDKKETIDKEPDASGGDDDGGGEDDDVDPDGDGGGAAQRISIGYGEAMEDDEGVLDLQNWSECVLCGEPVDNSWDRCPTCGKKNPSGNTGVIHSSTV